ncbi:MAG: tetratricopeptide repeat protein [Granulosicoccus sp.]
MPSSTVRRERLVTPLNLALMVGIFALAFYLLKPDDESSTRLVEKLSGTPSDASDSDSNKVDQLDLAYLKALKSSNEIDDGEVAGVISGLLRNGRADDASSLLSHYPGLELSEALRFELDMQLASTESPMALAASLEHLLATKSLQQTHLLQQAVQLSRSLSRPELTYDLYHLSAGDPAQSGFAAFRECGDYMVSIAEREYAVSCYQTALTLAQQDEVEFDVKLALLQQLEPRSFEQQELVDELMDSTSSVEHMTRLAPALLAIESPETAYRIYARLALQDKDNAHTWLPKASQWAQAAGKPAEAAVFLDALSKSKSGEPLKQLRVEIRSLLVAAGRNREAFERVRVSIAEDSDNMQALAEGIELALSLGESEQALLWNTRWLDKYPKDNLAMERQSDLALAAADLTLALQWAKHQVELEPNSLSARVRLAQVSEWSGFPESALMHWQWLSKASNEPSLAQRKEALRQVVRLGALLLEPATAALALRELSLFDALGDDQILQLVGLYELDGRPWEAATAIQDMIVLHGASPFYLRTLAALEYRHKRYEQSLAAWDQYVEKLGPDSDSTLARMELLWRLDRVDEAAVVAQQLKGNSLLSQASDYQLRLMAEISWRYEMSWLALLVQPRLDSLKIVESQKLYASRALEDLSKSGEYDQALQAAVDLWSSTGQAQFAYQSMQLAVKTNNKPVQQQFMARQREVRKLHKNPEYWTELAAIHLRTGDTKSALQDYQRALKLDSQYVRAIVGLMWLSVGEGDEALLLKTLQDYNELAQKTPELWQAMAVGYLQLGAASTSLRWFDKVLDQIKTDYGMLLTYADALEYAGRAGQARKVRQYTLQRLRPLLIDGSQREQALLLRQYGRLSTRYGDIGSNEKLVDYLLTEGAHKVSDTGSEQLWREDMAISWLMATQQHEHARLIMAQLHSKRLQAPAWQQVAIALKDKDNEALQALVQAKGPLSVGNHILALRQLGNDRKAYAMAQKALQPGAYLAGGSLFDRRIAQEQYASLRDSRPSYLSGSVSNRSYDGLGVSETGFALRHSLNALNLGLGLQVSQRQLDSDQYDINGNDELSDIALSLFFGSTVSGGRITTGFMSTEEHDLSYASGKLFRQYRQARRELAAELAYQEAATGSAELIIAGRRNRASLSVDQSFGRREFIRLTADAMQIHTMVEQDKVATGLGGAAELGMRGAFGSNAWSTSVRAGQISYQRESDLPEELRLSDQTTFDSVLAKEVQTLSLGASLSRGGINGEFPQLSSPRYYLNASMGQSWPARELGFQFDAGAGIRVLGGDELSFSVAHDTLGNSAKSDDATSLGVNYRYHF